MSIKIKLFFYLTLISIFTIIFTTYFSIISMSSKLANEEKKDLISSARKAERFFYDYLSNMTRTAIVVSELKEVVSNIKNPSELSYVLESKEVLFPSMNMKILNTKGVTSASYNSSLISCYEKKDLSNHPILLKGKEGLIRGAGIFSKGKHLCMVSIVPIVDQESFNLKGYVFLEFPISSEFVDILKDKVKEEVFIEKGKEAIASTYIGKEGKRLYPPVISNNNNKVKEGKLEGKTFFFSSFPIKDYTGKIAGKVIIGRDESALMTANRMATLRLVEAALIVLVLAVLFALFIGKKLSVPILALTKGAEKWSEGKLEYRVKVRAKDELGLLSKVFNKMAGSIESQRKEIEEVKRFFESIVESNPVGIITCDELGKIITVNLSAREIISAKKNELKGREIFELAEGLDKFKPQFIQVLLQKKPYSEKEVPIKTIYGEKKTLNILLYTVPLESGEIIVFQMEDITKKMELEKELHHLRKLGTIGMEVSRFAHEMNNIMTSLLGHISLLRLHLANTNLESKVKTAEEIAKKASSLAKEILMFSKKEELKNEEINVREILDGIEKMFRRILPENISFRREFCSFPLRIFGNSGKFSLAIYNLLINSMDAISASKNSSHGIIKLKTTREFSTDKGENFVKINIEDNGKGIEKEIQSKIFEPYFTTKGGKGTGLGLSLVKEVVEEMGGSINLESELGKGTKFSLIIPEMKTKGETERKEKIKKKIEGMGKKVLVIDDEKDIVHFLKELLEMYGFVVFGASDSKEAEEIIETEGEQIKIAIIDYTLGGKNGREIAKKLLRKNERVKIIMTSGFEDIEIGEGMTFLRKPFETEDIVNAISEAIKG